MRRLWIVFCMVVFCQPGTAQRPARNVVIVMTDGMRWQEVFRGADEKLLTAENNHSGRPLKDLQRDYLAGTADARRQALMPFFWSTIAQKGQVFGDQDAGSRVAVMNGFNRSYPGYNETLTGRPNPAIQTNDDVPNPRSTVLEWLNNQKEFHGHVAAFASWERISAVLRADRCGFPVHVAMQPFTLPANSSEMADLNTIKQTVPRPFGDSEVLDAPEFFGAMQYLRVEHPRVFFIQLIETDAWAHQHEYGNYLDAAHHVDRFLKILWDTLLSMPQYRGSTALVFTTDHGRGYDAEWYTHGEKFAGADSIFAAYLGSGVKPLGLRRNGTPTLQGQLAATVARLLGKDFAATDESIAPPLHLEDAGNNEPSPTP